MPTRTFCSRAALAALVILALALGGCGQDEDPATARQGEDTAAPAPVAAAPPAPPASAEPPAQENLSPAPGASPFVSREAPPESTASQDRTVAAGPPRAAAKKAAPRAVAPAPAPRGAATLQDATTLFAPFARDWLGTISRNLRHTASDMEIAVDGDGTVVARFVEVDPDSLDMRVKPSASGGAACPFVGVMRYLEHRYESRAVSEAQARRGPFTLVATRRVTEIFRYVSGRWTN